jgi:hypothetical protein
MLVPDHAALGEDVRPGADAFERACDDLLGVAEAVDRCGVDPVDAGIEGFPMAATESRSACDPQPNSQPEPPIAQAPKPIGVMSRSELPSRGVFIVLSFRI